MILSMRNQHNTDMFDYQLLGRLQQDCEYYLGAGAGDSRRLWALDVSLHIQKMRELYEKLPVKPVWLTLEDIAAYEERMSETKRDTEHSTRPGM